LYSEDDYGCLAEYQDVSKFTTDDGTVTITVFAVIDTLAADNVGFIFFKTNSSPERDSSTSSESITITIYDSVLVNGNSITAQEKGGEYLFACHITGILEPDFDTPFYVRAFSVVDGTVKYMTVKTMESVGLPINYWTAGELAYKAIKDTIVESISARQISRYLKEIDLKIHQFEGWLNLKDKLKDPEEFERRTDIVQIYLNSNNLQQEEDFIF